jgi:hypothetical protein
MTNMTGMNNLTSFSRVVDSVNTATNGIAGLLVLISLFVVIFVMLLRNNQPQESFLAASAVTTIASLLMLAGGFASIIYVVGFMLLFAISAIALYLNR